MSVHEELPTTARPPTPVTVPARPGVDGGPFPLAPPCPSGQPPPLAPPGRPAPPDLPEQRSLPHRGGPPLRFVALGDSLPVGVGDPVGPGRRGWAALLAEALGDRTEFANLAVSGALTLDVAERQLPAALDLSSDWSPSWWESTTPCAAPSTSTPSPAVRTPSTRPSPPGGPSSSPPACPTPGRC